MAERKPRKIKEAGHRRKFLVIVDETPECEAAVYFSACRARSTDSDLTMLCIIEPEGFEHWLQVGELHRQEGEQKAAAIFRLYQRKLHNWGLENVPVHEVVRHGDKPEQILDLIHDDEDIAFLILGASSSTKGPGRLVTLLAGKQAGSFPIPIVIIPGALDLDEINALA